MRYLLFVSLAILTGLTAGCRRGTKTADTGKGIAVIGDPWANAVKSMAKQDEQSVADLRRVLEQLNSEMAASEAGIRPVPLSAEREKQYRELLPAFGANDWAEVTSASFTKLDTQYLAECQFFREAVQSLDLADLSPEEKARQAFNWVCRLMYVGPSMIDGPQGTIILPPSPGGYGIRRGWGSGLERAYAFLSALQQIGLDGCLIGPPGSDVKPWAISVPEKGSNAMPQAPFWAVGVRVDKEILVFSPWRGEAAPGQNGRVATLSALKANPEAVKAWFDGNLTAGAVSTSEPFLTVPISAIALRWSMFESKLSSGVNLFIDPVAMRKAFGPNVKYWCPINTFDYSRVLPSFLPITDGGRDQGQALEQVLGQYRFLQFPRSLLIVPPELQNQEAKMLLIGQTSGMYDQAFVSGVTPRERLARGQFFEVTKDLVEKERKFSAAATRFLTQQSNTEPLRNFTKALDDACYAKSRELGKPNPDPTMLAMAQQNIEKLLKDNYGVFQMLLDSVIGLPASAESTYLLALCKQEMAERFQMRADRVAKAAAAATTETNADPKKLAAVRDGAEKAMQKASEAWAGARDWWTRYESMREAQGKAFPGRSAHAKSLAERANRQIGR
jgi:hypothetical protein